MGTLGKTAMLLGNVRFVLPLVLLAASPPERFDLLCNGKSEGYPVDRDTATRYHVDLPAKQWCSDECPAKADVAEEPNVLWFMNKPSRFVGDDEWIEYVNRTSGEWVRFIGPWRTTGHCELAPFTDLPAAPTKF